MKKITQIRVEILQLLLNEKQANPRSNTAGLNLGRIKDNVGSENIDFEMWMLTGLKLVNRNKSFYQITAKGVLALEESLEYV